MSLKTYQKDAKQVLKELERKTVIVMQRIGELVTVFALAFGTTWIVAKPDTKIPYLLQQQRQYFQGLPR